MKDVVSIHNLEVLCAIGIWDWEQNLAQKLEIDLDMHCDFRQVISSHKLKDTVDYVDVSRKIEKLLHGKNFGYLEVVVDKVCNLVFRNWESVERLRFSIRKYTRDIPSARCVSVSREIARGEWEALNGTRRLRKLEERARREMPTNGEKDLEGRTALITGSAKRLGREMALHMAGRGAGVAIHYLNSEKEALELKDELKAAWPEQRFGAYRADMSVPDDIVKMAHDARRDLKGIDILVNNVGHYVPKGVLEMTGVEWEETMRVNLDGVFHLTRALLPGMSERGWGRVINIGHAGSAMVVARPENTAYHITKTGIAIITRTLADLCGPKGVTVNMISPGILENSVDLPANIDAAIPLRRLGTMEDIVEGLKYLTSPGASYVTGAVLDICGGYGLATRN